MHAYNSCEASGYDTKLPFASWGGVLRMSKARRKRYGPEEGPGLGLRKSLEACDGKTAQWCGGEVWTKQEPFFFAALA